MIYARSELSCSSLLCHNENDFHTERRTLVDWASRTPNCAITSRLKQAIDRFHAHDVTAATKNFVPKQRKGGNVLFCQNTLFFSCKYFPSFR